MPRLTIEDMVIKFFEMTPQAPLFKERVRIGARIFEEYLNPTEKTLQEKGDL